LREEDIFIEKKRRW